MRPAAWRVAKPAVSGLAAEEQFNRLPAHLRNNEKYAWANPALPAGNHSSSAGRLSNIDSNGVSGSSSESRRNLSPHSSGRCEMIDSYRPSANPQDEMDDCSPSTSKQSTYTGSARPTNSPSNDAHLARTIHSDASQRPSSEYKKPGVLKHRSAVQEQGGRPSSDNINPERRARLDELNVEMAMEMGDAGEVAAGSRFGTLGRGANREDLPFNRLERRGEQRDTEMRDGGF